MGTATACLEVAAPGCSSKARRTGNAAGKQGEVGGSSCQVAWQLRVAWILSTRTHSLKKRAVIRPLGLEGSLKERAAGGVGACPSQRGAVLATHPERAPLSHKE